MSAPKRWMRSGVVAVSVLAVAACSDPPAAPPPDAQEAFDGADAGRVIEESVCHDLDVEALFESVTPGFTWEVRPDRVVRRAAYCRFDATDPDPPGFRTVDVPGDPIVLLRVTVADPASTRACYASRRDFMEIEGQGLAERSVPLPAQGWWDTGLRQYEPQVLDSRLAPGAGPRRFGTSQIRFIVRSEVVCAFVHVVEGVSAARELPAREARDYRLGELLLDALPEHLATEELGS